MQLKRDDDVCCVCEGYKGDIVVMDVSDDDVCCVCEG